LEQKPSTTHHTILTIKALSSDTTVLRRNQKVSDYNPWSFMNIHMLTNLMNICALTWP
jgi:hypothetical protein